MQTEEQAKRPQQLWEKAEATQFDIVSRLLLQVFSANSGLFIPRDVRRILLVMWQWCGQRAWAHCSGACAWWQWCDIACTAPRNHRVFSISPPHHRFPRAPSAKMSDVFLSQGLMACAPHLLQYNSSEGIKQTESWWNHDISFFITISRKFLSFTFLIQIWVGRICAWAFLLRWWYNGSFIFCYGSATFTWFLLWQTCSLSTNAGKILLSYWYFWISLQPLYQHRMSLPCHFSLPRQTSRNHFSAQLPPCLFPLITCGSS